MPFGARRRGRAVSFGRVVLALGSTTSDVDDRAVRAFAALNRSLHHDRLHAVVEAFDRWQLSTHC